MTPVKIEFGNGHGPIILEENDTFSIIDTDSDKPPTTIVGTDNGGIIYLKPGEKIVLDPTIEPPIINERIIYLEGNSMLIRVVPTQFTGDGSA